MNVLNAMKEIVEAVNETSEDTATAENLLNLKKELAEQIVEKMEAESPDLLLSMGRDFVVDYLVDEGMMDKIHDAFVEKGLDALTSVSPKLKELREKLGKVWTEAELQHLKAEILHENVAPASEAAAWVEVASTSPTSKPSSEALASSPSVSSSSFQGSAVESSFREAPNELLAPGVLGFNAAKIQSSPFERSRSGTTLCAKTAKENAEKFGIELPSGNARDASQELPIAENYITSLPIDKKTERPQRSRESLTIEDFNAMEGVNVADIYPDSKSKYGHRALAFRDVSGERMVLDPYIKVNGVRDRKPKKLEDYLQARKIFKSHFYVVDHNKKLVA